MKQREFEGYAYDGAEASFELLARRALGAVPDYFRLTSFRVIDERRWNARNELVTLSEATIKVEVGGETIMTVAEGNGPVNALDTALRQALTPVFPELAGIRLIDYKVRILTPQDGDQGGDPGDDRDDRRRRASAGRRSASRPTSSMPRTTRCTTASPTSCGARGGGPRLRLWPAPIIAARR